MNFTTTCPVCGGNNYIYNKVLWPDLINSWELDDAEIEYINRQQGLSCLECGNNLRSMALANAISYAYQFSGTLTQFIKSGLAKKLNILEINNAGGLTPLLQKSPNHHLIQYPEYDMTNLSLTSDTFDLVIHSDTLEHVPDPVKALSECYRVLRKSGKCIFTVPIITNRMSRTRSGLPPSYHGQSGVPADDQLVHTEFGADVWQTALNAGFFSCEIFSLEYPAGLAIISNK
jgi:SAM-dependent methyltransferase